MLVLHNPVRWAPYMPICVQMRNRKLGEMECLSKAQGHRVGLDGAGFHKSALQFPALQPKTGVLPGTVPVNHSPFSPLPFPPCPSPSRSPACERAEFDSDPSSREGPRPTLCAEEGTPPPKCCLGLSTPPPAREGRRPGKRNPLGPLGHSPRGAPVFGFN